MAKTTKYKVFAFMLHGVKSPKNVLIIEANKARACGLFCTYCKTLGYNPLKVRYIIEIRRDKIKAECLTRKYKAEQERRISRGEIWNTLDILKQT